MASIFTKIISGEISGYKIAEDENHLAFLDILPLKKGHVLVIPKKEVDYYFDLSNEEISNLTIFVKKIATALKAAIPCVKVAVAIIGLEVPHTHIHLVPIDTIGELNFSNSRLKFTKDEFESVAMQIKSKLK